MNFLPDRKVWAGGIAGIAAWGILGVATHYGITLPIDPAMLAGTIGWLIAYIVPPAEQDIVKRLNDDIVKMAQNDPAVPVTKP